MPASPPTTNRTSLLTGPALLFSSDLSQDVVNSYNDLTGGAPANPAGNLFLRNNFGPTHGLMTALPSTPAGATATYTLVGASADFSRIVFQANVGLTADAIPSNSISQVYEWHAGTLSLVTIVPVAEPTPHEEAAPGGGEATSAFGIPKPNTVSADGSRIFFTSPSDLSSPPQLFMRVGGTETVEVSASQREEADPVGLQAATFQGASASGSSVFFTSNSELTDDANTGEGDSGANLYRYDAASGELEDLTVDAEAGDLAGADVRGVLVAGGRHRRLLRRRGRARGRRRRRAPSNLYRWSAAGRGGLRRRARRRGAVRLGRRERRPRGGAPTAPAAASCRSPPRAGAREAAKNPRPPAKRCRRSTAGPAADGLDLRLLRRARRVAVRGADGDAARSFPGGERRRPPGRRRRQPGRSSKPPTPLVPGDSNGRDRRLRVGGRGVPHLISCGGRRPQGSILVDAAPVRERRLLHRPAIKPGRTPIADDNSDVYDARVGRRLPGPRSGPSSPASAKRAGRSSASAAGPAAARLGGLQRAGQPERPSPSKSATQAAAPASTTARRCGAKKCPSRCNAPRDRKARVSRMSQTERRPAMRRHPILRLLAGDGPRRVPAARGRVGASGALAAPFGSHRASTAKSRSSTRAATPGHPGGLAPLRGWGRRSTFATSEEPATGVNVLPTRQRQGHRRRPAGGAGRRPVGGAALHSGRGLPGRRSSSCPAAGFEPGRRRRRSTPTAPSSDARRSGTWWRPRAVPARVRLRRPAGPDPDRIAGAPGGSRAGGEGYGLDHPPRRASRRGSPLQARPS